ncbi:MAG: hypothetical protein HOP19_07795 [Acidobacteria bacterium]|nr:hypothetical protein [Acidobacteriota bacterium]
MSTLTAENILILIEQLPPLERERLDQILIHQPTAPAKVKAPLDKRVPYIPVPDRTKEWDWIEQHKYDYAGKWVALEGDTLVAASDNRLELSALIKAAGAKQPLIHRMSSPDDLLYIGI